MTIRTKPRQTHLRRAAYSVALALLPTTLRASTATWDGNSAVGNIGDGVNWSDPNNWTTDGVIDSLPLATSPYSDVSLGNGTVGTIQLGGNRAVHSLTFNSNFTIDSPGTADRLSHGHASPYCRTSAQRSTVIFKVLRF